MRILVYAMQSSGSSLFAYLLAQKPNTIGIIDLFNQVLAPSHSEFPVDSNVILKCTVSKLYTIEDHVSSFKPDAVVCFTRDYEQIEKSLSTKPYAEIGGTISEKIQHFEDSKTYQFTHWYSFSEMMNRVPMEFISDTYYSLSRSLAEIVAFNSNFDWCRSGLRTTWFIGNIHLEDNRDINVLTVEDLQSAVVKNPFVTES